MSILIKKAKIFAYERHAGQVRKGNEDPFITHLEKVTDIIKTLTDDEEVIAAAWLHDVVEDTETTLEEIYELFGERVRRFVELESEDKRHGTNEKDSWKARKEEQIKTLASISKEDSDVFMITLSDKLSNTRDMLEAKKEKGMAFLDVFNNTSPDDQHWYYKSFADVIGEKSNLGETSQYEEYLQVIEKLFKK